MSQSHSGTPRPTLRIAGRILNIYKRNSDNGTSFRTLVAMPAPDEFSSPGHFELRSTRNLGQVGHLIEVDAEVQGYKRSYPSQENPGQKVQTAEVVLTVQ